MSVLQAVSTRRRRIDRFVRFGLLVGFLLALAPLVLVLGFVIAKGVGAISWQLLSSDPTGAFLGDPGGIKSAILGTLEIVLLATIISVPVSTVLAIYLSELGGRSKLAITVRYFVDVLTGVPSIVFGLFIYIIFVIGGVVGGFAAWKGSLALALLMLPIVTRAAEITFASVPNSLREAALALGAPRWRMITQIILPTALPGLMTGSLLAIARASGETAPLLFTVLGAQATTYALGAQMNSLPLQIFSDVRAPSTELVNRAWASALTLIVIILIINISARVIAKRSRLA